MESKQIPDKINKEVLQQREHFGNPVQELARVLGGKKGMSTRQKVLIFHLQGSYKRDKWKWNMQRKQQYYIDQFNHMDKVWIQAYLKLDVPWKMKQH